MSGKPSLAGNYPFILTATDQTGLTASQGFTLSVSQFVYQH
jgi:hypothetical protein